MSNEPDNGNGEDLASKHGIRTLHERMPNGELRFRLIGPNGSSYIRTVAGSQGAWQNSHYHRQLYETYIVESGWIIMAELDEQSRHLTLRRYFPGDVITSPIQTKHNIYLASGSVIHTVKHGSIGEEADWHPAPDLDLITQAISEQDLLNSLNRTIT